MTYKQFVMWFLAYVMPYPCRCIACHKQPFTMIVSTLQTLALMGDINLTWVIFVALASKIIRVFWNYKFMPSIECSIVIIDQYYENSHYYATMQVCEGSGDFLSALLDYHVTTCS